MPLIQLKACSLHTEIDEEDVALVSPFTWYLQRSGGNTYALTWTSRRTGHVCIRMHRLILPGVAIVDHKDGNGLNNRRSNLRPARQEDNLRNTKPFIRSDHYKGIYRKHGRWAAGIQFHKKSKYLGTFDTPEEAAKRYDAEAVKLFGEFAWVNFPEVVDNG